MQCCAQCQGIETLFDEKLARRDLEDYRRHGLDRETRLLVEALAAQGVEGAALLDIGGGVGAVQHALIAAGAARAVSIDASGGYTKVAREENEARGLADRIAQRHGNFVELAPQVETADVVTLARVICCYDDMRGLVSASAGKAGRLYGLIYPRDSWWARGAMAAQHALARLFGWKMRFFAHRTADVDALVRAAGLAPFYWRKLFFWQVVVYGRSDAG
jgi:magnesium-protoporphyrin O-methyltransferase